MTNPKKAGPQRAVVLSRRSTERTVAVLLGLYALALLVMIISRVSSGADQSTAEESIRMIGVNSGWYVGIPLAALTAGFLLVAVAAVSYRVFRIWEPTLALLGSLLFLSAAGAVCLGAIGGLTLAQEYGGAFPAQAPPALVESVVGTYTAIEPLRALAGRVGFTFAGLGLLTWSGLITFTGAAPRWFGWLGLPVGAVMFFIWVPDASAMHRIGGIAYILWLTLLAGWLFVRGTTERPQE